MANSNSHPKKRVELGAAVRKGAFWVGTGQAIKEVFLLSSTIILARIYDPKDYGIMAGAMVIAHVCYRFADFGLERAIILQKKLSKSDISTATFLALAQGAAVAAIMAISAYPMEHVMALPGLHRFVWIIAFRTMLETAFIIPKALLSKALRFRARSLSELLQSLTESALAITLALSGFGPITLAIACTGGSAIGLFSAGVLSWKELTFCRPSIESGKKFMSVGSWLWLHSTINGVGAELDQFFIARGLGASALGLCERAVRLIKRPINRLNVVLSLPIFPAFAKLQNNLERMKSALLKAISIRAACLLPVLVGLACCSRDAVLLLLGDKWLEVAPLTSILCLAMIVELPSGFTQQCLVALSKVRSLAVITTIIQISYLFGVLVVLPFGLIYVFGVRILRSLGYMVFRIRALKEPVNLRLIDAWSVCFLIYIAGGIEAVALIVLNFIMPSEMSIFVRVLLDAIIGIFIYALTLLALRPRIISDEIADMIRKCQSFCRRLSN